ncbi:hypothetical protein HD553DRAFT_330412 [Filobasidium floriforme]|uniref:uncharacterized protein n=1 Tax=Filobasidium floriforme TaxID=5210 RepID=UPI001E8DFFCF|nr:uncharacterized protein HD553DRAFT_330412 [Filobasidium floriforme]KAH8090850.1 hypothetical protein HD553DRAFT_330412 [Filobasidium floriforme]
MTMDMDFTDDFDALDSLNNLEQTYYQQGYKDGFEHGRLHGLFEGRAIGQEKAFEIWEEVGYIEGIALFWRAVAEKQTSSQAEGGKKVSPRAQNHIQTLLNLISTFPTDNPTPVPDNSSVQPDATMNAGTESLKPQDEPDLAVLLERIRARYKLLCSSLGVRPRLAVASRPEDTGPDLLPRETSGVEVGIVMGAEGSGVAKGMIDGVDTRMLRF